jgi:mono/diheme cytochrome c family protein
MKHTKTLCTALLFASAVAAFGQAASAPPPSGGKSPLYTVVDGNKVDPNTLQGFKTWRAAACDRCHGANQEGLVGPSLLTSLKTLSKEDFAKTVANGRPNTQMVAFSGNAEVMQHLDQLYAYLKGRSDGAITKARVEAMP